MMPRLVPVLLIEERSLIKTQKFGSPVYLGDPINALKIFNEKEVDEVIIIDRSANSANGPDFDFLEQLSSEAFMPLGYIGGIRSVEEGKRLISLGFEKIGFNSAIITNGDMVTTLTNDLGAQSVFAVIDVKKPLLGAQKAFISHGKVNTKITPEEFANRASSLGIGEIIVQSVDRDGVMQGYDIDLIQKISKSVTVPVVALGGAGSFLDFQRVIKAGASAVAAGSFFVFLNNDRSSILINYPEYRKVEEIFGVKL